MYSKIVCGFVLFAAYFCLTLQAAEIGSNDNEISNRGINAASLLQKITSSLMTRSDGSTSQVLSLNLTNLLILILLKALIFAAGSIGAGGYKHGYGGYSHGRSVEDLDDRFISDSEILLYLSYLSGSPGKYQCFQNVACHRPELAMQYAKAGKLVLKAAKIMPNVVNIEEVHEQTLLDLQKAAEIGKSETTCDEKYKCTE